MGSHGRRRGQHLDDSGIPPVRSLTRSRPTRVGPGAAIRWIVVGVAFALFAAACAEGTPSPGSDTTTTARSGTDDAVEARPSPGARNEDGDEEEALAALRNDMVERQIEARGVEDETVLRAMRDVPRHRFVPGAPPAAAYGDRPLPIGHGQTISQPYIVAYMAEAADISPDDRVLEIGTGSGYGAAVLAELASEVYTVEIIPELARRAEATLAALDYDNVNVRTGNGWLGWPEQAPFDGVVVTAAPDRVPEALVDQLAVGGSLVVPVGERRQTLRVLRKTSDGLVEESALPVRFVPMVAEPETGDGVQR